LSRAPSAPSELSDLEWMALQVEGLFRQDARGRLARRRDPATPDAPPRFFFGRTRAGNLWRFADDVRDATVRDLARLAAAEREMRPLEQPPERMEAFRARLERDGPVAHVYHGPAFRFPEPSALPDPGDDVAFVTPGSERVLEAHLAEWGDWVESRAPMAVALDARGDAVAVCACATVGHATTEAGVETAAGFRRRGLATRVVAAWARAVQGCGRIPLYSTTWDNAGSRGVARKLGLIRFGVDLHFR
jgi:hypothetical protein